MSLSKMLGAEEAQKVCLSKLLVVGAGGIGCEILKNLVLLGFRDIVCIDLDTIDVSNLNRQFLFRKRHVDQPKAIVASEVVQEFGANINSKVNIEARHANIKDPEYNVEFFSTFAAVLNCLDNVSARRHVNRLCLASKVPLIEAGTTGYLGQTTVYRKGDTECYECQPKATPKQYPVCTIRSTPEEPVHCIVWAKEVFKQLFGPKDSESILSDLEDKLEAVKSSTGESLRSALADLFTLLYATQISELKEVWQAKREAPEPIAFPQTSAPSDDRTAVWTVAECAHVFIESVSKILTSRKELVGMMEFSKDDGDAVDFVCAASNLRMTNFHIGNKSRWDVESIAGNIVPAIATTNAIVAGFQVTNLIHLLTDKSRCREVWVRYPEPLESKKKGTTICTPCGLMAPNKECYVCGSSMITMYVQQLEKLVITQFAKMLQNAISCNRPAITHNQTCIYDPDYPEASDEALEEGLHPDWTMEKWGVKTGVILEIQDESQDFQVDLLVHSVEELDEEKYPGGFRVGKEENEEVPAAKPEVAAPSTDDQATAITFTDDVPEEPDAKKLKIN